MKFENILNAAMGKESFYIPKEMIINGTIKAEVPGQIAGIIYGDVLVKSKLIVLKEGVVNGDASAEELIVFGRINGDVRQCQKITVHSGSVIRGNINTIEIHVEKDTEIEGVITKSGVQSVMNKKKESVRKDEEPHQNNESIFPNKDVSVERHAWF